MLDDIQQLPTAGPGQPAERAPALLLRARRAAGIEGDGA
jgi:hypothetical protein